MEEDLLLDRNIAIFQGRKCNYAAIYLKISAMEGEIFWAFLILVTMSTIVFRRIFDKCANYVEIFVIRSGYSEFSRWKMYFAPIYLKISAMESEIFWAFLILGTISAIFLSRIFYKCANYVERFVKRSGYCEFSRWKMYLSTNLS